MNEAVLETDLNLPNKRRGKVRDISAQTRS